MSILHVDLISCRYLNFCTFVVAGETRTYVRMLDIRAACHKLLVVCTFEADRKCLVSLTRAAFAGNDRLTLTN